jgi:HEAT repeat protein
LGRIGRATKEAMPQLIEALKDPNEVRRDAADALKKIGEGAKSTPANPV